MLLRRETLPVGSLWLILVFACSASCSQSSQVEIISQAPSPKGRFLATVWTESGGGAAGWCRSYLAVTLFTSDLIITPQDAIALGRCDDLDPMRWVSDTQLEVHYKTALALEQTAVLNGQVQVAYKSP